MRRGLFVATLAHVAAILSSAYDYAQSSDEEYDENPCLPQIADRCFKDVYENLLCHVDPSSLPDCVKKNVDDFCDAASDALDCAVAIVDGDCTIAEGSDVFDAWISGLRNVYKTFCTAEKQLLSVLVAAPNCWNSIFFLKCVERTIRVNSTVDLMRVPLDLAMCNQIAVAASACNVKATRPSELCEAPQGAISEAIHSFFTGTKCGVPCVSSATMVLPHALSVACLTCYLCGISAMLFHL
ncbi:uncharacterized protein LOC124551140 [Schistocerca americana]|uniref:uncharacterized protein LOC124551140 n=1 Tax=Schistocerca americana TaxID=7009 RepID=UPI001F5007B6|nr:uncharacterized protein LOC124551140 [Schistocerca americana]